MKQEYSFLQDALQIMSRRWVELNVKEIGEGSSLHEIRKSKEYLSEFIFSIANYVNSESMDYSPYLHACNYILNHFETFEDLDTTLYDEYGDDAYIISADESTLSMEEFKEKNAIITDYVRMYVEEYTSDIPSLLKRTTEEVVFMVFHLTILIMLELEMEFVSFFSEE